MCVVLAVSGSYLLGPLFWFPMLAAILFAFGALLMKGSARWPVGVWRTTFVSNLTTATMFVPLLALEGRVPSWADLWQPFMVGALFVLGQVTALIALTRGEVSVATPVLGLKIVMVAVFSRLLIARPLPPQIWTASLLATLGVILLNVTPRRAARGSVTLSVACALIAAAAFGLFDVCVQMWSPDWGLGTFLPLAFAGSALLSMAFLPLFSDSLVRIPRPAWPWLGGGCLLIALQSFAIVCTVAQWGNATVVNIVYSTRGLWGVMLVWLIGPRLGVHDATLTRPALLCRLLGAALLMLAVLLLLV